MPTKKVKEEKAVELSEVLSQLEMRFLRTYIEDLIKAIGDISTLDSIYAKLFASECIAEYSLSAIIEHCVSLKDDAEDILAFIEAGYDTSHE